MVPSDGWMTKICVARPAPSGLGGNDTSVLSDGLIAASSRTQLAPSRLGAKTATVTRMLATSATQFTPTQGVEPMAVRTNGWMEEELTAQLAPS